MARLRWLERVRHPPVKHAGPAAYTLPSRSPEELIEEFRKNPTASDLRPIVRAMSRDVVAWLIGHPAACSAQETRLFRAEILTSPELEPLFEARMRHLAQVISQASTTGHEIPALTFNLPLRPTTEGFYDDILDVMPTGSFVRFDIGYPDFDLTTAHAAVQRLRDRQIRVSLSGLSALVEDGMTDEAGGGETFPEGHDAGAESRRDLVVPADQVGAVPELALTESLSEEEIVRELAPDVLVYDSATPLEYRDRMPQLLRLRAAAGRPQVLVSGVSTAVDEWAAITCGANWLSGPFYERESMSGLDQLADRPELRRADEELSAYEVAAKLYTPRTVTVGEALDLALELHHRVCAVGDYADAYLSMPTIEGIPTRALAAIEAMLRSGAAVTTVSPDLTAAPAEGMIWGRTDPDDSLAQDWVFVTLFPGEGQVLVARPSQGADITKGLSYIFAQDREIALRIARRISRSANGQ
ncbi:hypothetical protein [Austwickia chelonae]|uniref:hypothetical protein n=1 Tax=Austwickia chelonae TaxID=100225 RepID=UPI000E286CE8|nr:hypothetical protein [Austwickia chelonae]